MARLIIATGMGEPEFSSNRGLIHAFKALGHEVITAGPGYWGRPPGDIALPDMPFPETYGYEEVLSRVSGKVDLVLQIEPHFYLRGPKPSDIISAYLFTDPHRGGAMWYRMAEQGEFNHVFVGQKFFWPLFTDLDCDAVHYLPVGFDERRFPPDDPYWHYAPECDIVFVGQTGLANMTFPNKDEVGQFATTTPRISGHEKFAFGFHPGYDYAERGELLYRLCRDFDVRIYSEVWDTPDYFRALRKGVIGFNCSLLHDLSIRCLEVAAAGRLLITDQVDDIPDVFATERPSPRQQSCVTYDLHYKPFFENFNLSYKEVCRYIKYWLSHTRERENLVALAKDCVWGRHTWRHRANQILSVIFNQD